MSSIFVTGPVPGQAQDARLWWDKRPAIRWARAGTFQLHKTTPGTGYEFVTDPAGGCGVKFTVTKG
jgi:hypothetical protein